MKRLAVLPLIALLLCGAMLPAEENPKALRVVALRITKTPAEEDKELYFGFEAGTRIELIAHLPGKRILALDSQASTLVRFTDDKKTDLSQTDGFGWLTDLGSRISRDGTRMSMEVRSSVRPAAGATRLFVQGTIVVKVGSREKTVVAKNVTLKDDTAIKIGPFQIRRSKDEFGESLEKVGKEFEKALKGFAGTLLEGFGVGDMAKMPKQKGKAVPEVRVTLRHGEPNVKSVEFLDRDGKVIPSQSGGVSYFAAFGGPPTYTTQYRVKGHIEKATVRVRYFSKIESVKVPLNLTVSVGF